MIVMSNVESASKRLNNGGAEVFISCWLDRRYLNIFRALLSSYSFLHNGVLHPFPTAADTGNKTPLKVVNPCDEELRGWPPLNLRDLLAQSDDTAVTPSARKILHDWLSPTSLATGLPGLPIASNEPVSTVHCSSNLMH